MTSGAFIGIDVGTTAVKALAVSPSGEVLARATAAYPLSTPRPGWAEQDPEDWWRATQEALAALAVEPAAIGLSGQMHGLVALDGADQVIRPAILWNDGRTQRQCEAIEETVGLDRLIALTGNRALAGFTAPKLLWLRDEEPDAFARIRSMLLPKDYVRLRMTASAASSATRPCICPLSPIAAGSTSSAASAWSVARHQSSGSCSAQPGRGVLSG